MKRRTAHCGSGEPHGPHDWHSWASLRCPGTHAPEPTPESQEQPA